MKRDTRIVDRQQYVVKANDLIRKTRYSLTTQQQKIVLFAISKIKPSDSADTWYEFAIEDVCNACGLDIDAGGTYYKRIKEDLQKLSNRQWCKMPDGSEKTMSWIGDASIIPLCGTVSIRFNPNMQPYLFDLKERYTQYRLENVLAFRGKYAIRLYEILKSYTVQKLVDQYKDQQVNFSIEQLRSMLDVVKYQTWADFNRYVIKTAVDEINSLSDELHISYELKRSGRSIEGIVFIINSARAKQELESRRLKRERLDKQPREKRQSKASKAEQQSIFDS